ncbi:putative Neuropeptide Y receptor [Hypsibius exemplaris]|uniref:Neuropeptide Y receptor n=1 Tax=Hypsibius exemplaris TaxID=2072580 RepID=A0A1W0WJH4_HYPEX|nr:putative Neuropeptide Y receptor [Hypsibius exemplaris]
MSPNQSNLTLMMPAELCQDRGGGLGDADFSNISFCEFFPEQCGEQGAARAFVKLAAWEFVTKLIFYLFVFLASFAGNVMVIAVVYLYRAKMQSSAYIYLLNLSVGGLIIALGCMWPYFIVSVAHEYPLGEALCKIHPFLQLTSMVSSVLTLATISLDQFVAVAFPIQARFTRRLRPIWVITGIWIVSAIVSVPFLITKQHIEYRFSDHSQLSCAEAWPAVWIVDPTSGRCTKQEPSKTTYYTFISTALFFFPVGIMIMAYTVIMCKVWSSHIPGDHHQEHNQAHARSKSKIVKLVAAVLVGFVICWMPLQIIILFERYNTFRADSDGLPTWFSEFSYFAHFIAYANSAINPLIYCFLNGKFRQGFIAVLTCHKARRKGSLADCNATQVAFSGLLRNDAPSRKGSRAVSFHISNNSSFCNGHTDDERASKVSLDNVEETERTLNRSAHPVFG